MSQSVLNVFEGQADQLTQFSQEMQVLQEVLTHGVTAFSDRLPQSVNQTLVQFDSALGEGVARLGSSISRLRETMDDVLERLDTMNRR